MAKYCFKVYLSDGSSIKITPSMIDEDHTELSDMDLFVYKCGGEFNLHSLLTKELELGQEHINKIKISQSRSEREFSIISNNPYLTSILTSVKRKKVHGYQNYEMDTMVVTSDNSNYIEMKNYLFENIQGDCNFFLQEVYKYNNEFAKLLYRYGTVYKQGLYSEEDLINIKKLKNKIELGLSIYKNYRGLCKARYEYENKYRYSPHKKQTTAKENITYRSPEYIEKEVTQEYLNAINQYVNYLGEEKEEFLDDDERESSQDYGKRR